MERIANTNAGNARLSPPGHDGDGGLSSLLDHGAAWICVVWIDNGAVAYLGRSLRDAARAMMPGTCFAIAEMESAARSGATNRAQEFRRKT